MSWIVLSNLLAAFDQLLARLRITVANDAAIAPQLALVRDFLNDRQTLSPDDFQRKWSSQFQGFYDAAITVHRLTEAAVTLSDQPAPSLRKRLLQVLSGSLTQDFEPQQAKDYFYELEIAAALKRAGFSVALREPDVVTSGNGLSGELGLACKYPSSAAQIHDHISNGYRQIANQNLRGCVVISLDLIVFRRAFDSPPKALDFRNRSPREVSGRLVKDAMTHLVERRGVDYPSEPPLDGAILTFSAWGIFGSPAGLTSVTSWSVQCDASSAIRPDLERVVSAARRLDTEHSQSQSRQ